MIDINEINGEIAKLEAMPVSYQTIERLALLYVVRDHSIKPVIENCGDSECMRACAGKTINEILIVVDELMDTLHIVQPRLYDAVMNRLL